MIGNQGGNLRKPLQPSRTGLSIQELKAMTALRMSQGQSEMLTKPFGGASDPSPMKSSQLAPATYAPVANNNSRSRRQASRAAATMYADQGEFGQISSQLQPPVMTRVTPSPPPASSQSSRAEKQPAHSLTVQELKELTRMRLAREAVNPGSNNTSLSNDGDLDLELHHHHTQGVHRKNSANSLLTTTTLESRESDNCSRPQSRSGTISPVSDSFIDDNELIFSYGGFQSASHTQTQPTGLGIGARRQANIVTPSYLPTRTVNFHANGNGSRGVGQISGQSSSQTLHSQTSTQIATAQMSALLMDQQRREAIDGSRNGNSNGNSNGNGNSIVDDGSNYDSGSLSSEHISLSGYSRLQQRFEENRAQEAQTQRRLSAQEHAMALARQQQLAVRRRTSFSSYQDNTNSNSNQIQNSIQNLNSKVSFDDFHSTNSYERGNDENSILSNFSQSENRDSFDRDRMYEERYRQSLSLSDSSSSDLNNLNNTDFRFNGDTYAPPPVMGIHRKQQQGVGLDGNYSRDGGLESLYNSNNNQNNNLNNNNNSNNNQNNNNIPPPPPMHMMGRGSDHHHLGSNSPSMRHKSALSIPCPGGVRERTLSDVNSLAFQMAEACLDSNSNPSTPKFSHRTFPPGLTGLSNSNAPDYLAQALRRMNSTDSVSSVGSNSYQSGSNGNGLSNGGNNCVILSVPRGIGPSSSISTVNNNGNGNGNSSSMSMSMSSSSHSLSQSNLLNVNQSQIHGLNGQLNGQLQVQQHHFDNMNSMNSNMNSNMNMNMAMTMNLFANTATTNVNVPALMSNGLTDVSQVSEAWALG